MSGFLFLLHLNKAAMEELHSCSLITCLGACASTSNAKDGKGKLQPPQPPQLIPLNCKCSLVLASAQKRCLFSQPPIPSILVHQFSSVLTFPEHRQPELYTLFQTGSQLVCLFHNGREKGKWAVAGVGCSFSVRFISL